MVNKAEPQLVIVELHLYKVILLDLVEVVTVKPKPATVIREVNKMKLVVKVVEQQVDTVEPHLATVNIEELELATIEPPLNIVKPQQAIVEPHVNATEP
ncbi:unnamed protein product [Pieris macdunnoughi]|uniref:Uncharacterized protein n=1 Tax=Pieris macdunnoughi TaxID=345717 RepID=A0A821NGT7_9NEOP|nr:unnamed protein product [Pieris macdunnoughi]